jgi:hypothetical protein
VKRIAVAAVVTAVALLSTAGQAAAHEVVVVCDEETGDLIWSNVPPPDLETTVVTSNGLTIVIPPDGTVTTEHPGPGTWIATWTDGETVSGVIPPECDDSSTTTVAPTTTAPPTTAPPTSDAGSNTVAPPSSASSSSSTGTLPETGSDLTVAAVGAALVAAGVLVTVVARRRAPTP